MTLRGPKKKRQDRGKYCNRKKRQERGKHFLLGKCLLTSHVCNKCSKLWPHIAIDDARNAWVIGNFVVHRLSSDVSPGKRYLRLNFKWRTSTLILYSEVPSFLCKRVRYCINGSCSWPRCNRFFQLIQTCRWTIH